MNEYDFHKDSLKPTKAYNHMLSPKNIKQKTSERSKSKEKMIVASFTKKQHLENNSKSPLSNPALARNKLSAAESPNYKNSPC
jgi:hypothetical protein